MTSNTTTTTNNFAPLTNKSGKVTATAEKRAILLNGLDSRGVLSIALNGKGAMAKQAQMSIAADSLDSLLNSDVALSGEKIAALRAFLIGAYGEASFNRETMKGLLGMVTYLDAVRLMLDHRFIIAETVKAQDNAVKALQALNEQMGQLQNLIVLRDEAIALTRAIVAEAAPVAEAVKKGKRKPATV